MSKSKRNTIDPEPIVDQYGADAVRWFMLSDSPPERDLEWSEAGIEGAGAVRPARLAAGIGQDRRRTARTRRSTRKLHRTIAAVGEAIEGLQFNKAVARLYELASAIEKAAAFGHPRRSGAHADPADRADGAAPRRGSLGGARRAKAWSPTRPGRTFDPALLVDDEVTLAVQVNGKLRDTLTAPRGLDRRRRPRRWRWRPTRSSGNSAGAAPRKVIVVPDRLVNIVA